MRSCPAFQSCASNQKRRGFWHFAISRKAARTQRRKDSSIRGMCSSKPHLFTLHSSLFTLPLTLHFSLFTHHASPTPGWARRLWDEGGACTRM